jgi:hypothetical protein
LRHLDIDSHADMLGHLWAACIQFRVENLAFDAAIFVRTLEQQLRRKSIVAIDAAICETMCAAAVCLSSLRIMSNAVGCRSVEGLRTGSVAGKWDASRHPQRSSSYRRPCQARVKASGPARGVGTWTVSGDTYIT